MLVRLTPAIATPPRIAAHADDPFGAKANDGARLVSA